MTGWGGALKLQATAASKTSVKLSWSKISGTKGYEVYRCVSTSGTTQVSKNEGNGYQKYKLVASLSASKKSYIDKGLTSGMAYTYSVRAYKMAGNKKVYIEDAADVALDFELTEISTVRKWSGKVTVTWNPVYTAKGYLIEKEDKPTGKWNKYKTIKKVFKSKICKSEIERELFYLTQIKRLYAAGNSVVCSFFLIAGYMTKAKK